MDQDQTIAELRREVVGLRFGLFLSATAILCFLVLINLIVGFVFPPKFEKIFEDMLGSRDKLPELTKWVLAYASGAGGVMPLAAVLSVGAFFFALMNLMRKSWRMVLVALVAFVLLTFHLVVLSLALFLPLIQIIQGINDKSV